MLAVYGRRMCSSVFGLSRINVFGVLHRPDFPKPAIIGNAGCIFSYVMRGRRGYACRPCASNCRPCTSACRFGHCRQHVSPWKLETTPRNHRCHQASGVPSSRRAKGVNQEHALTIVGVILIAVLIVFVIPRLFAGAFTKDKRDRAAMGRRIQTDLPPPANRWRAVKR